MKFIKLDYMFINLCNVDYVEFDDDYFQINFYFENGDSNIYYDFEDDSSRYFDFKRFILKEMIKSSLLDSEVNFDEVF